MSAPVETIETSDDSLRAELADTQRKLQFLVDILDYSDARLTLPDGTPIVSVTELLDRI